MALNKVVDWLFGSHFTDDSTTFHRRMLVIAKNANAGLADVQRIIECAPAALHACALTDRTINAHISKPIKLYKQILGQSYDLAIYDAIDEFRPSALLALAGTVSHQGCLVLITPPLDQWSQKIVDKPPFYLTYGFKIKVSRFIERLSQDLQRNEHVAIWQDEDLHLPTTQSLKQEFTSSSIFWSDEQKEGFSNLANFLHSQTKYAIIRAPRGRGKSSLLGLFSASCMAQGYRVLITSTAKRSVQGLIHICSKNLTSFAHSSPHTGITNRSTAIKWVAPDSPLLRENDFDLLIIDEAASFPAPLLLELCSMNRKVILSTTSEGYEGSGKGFEHKVVAELEKKRRVLHITLTQPLRWHKNDPLEIFLSHSLLFKEAAPAPSETTAVDHASSTMMRGDKLSDKELTKILQLLNAAHYQTTPDDLMRLVDSPDIVYALLKSKTGEIIAASAINIEGGERLSDLANDISKGKRRVKGHLSAQGLAYFAARPDLATMKYWRINRIAVNPLLHGKGVGSKLLAFILHEAKNNAIDAVTSSFGANLPLLKFWSKNHFALIKLGLKRNKASAAGSALVAIPLSSTAKKLFENLSLLGLEDAKYDRVEHNLRASFKVNQCDPTCLNDYYLGRWKHFCFDYRNVDSLSSAVPWLLRQLEHGNINSELATLDELLTTLNEIKKGHRVDKTTLEALRETLKSNFT